MLLSTLFFSKKWQGEVKEKKKKEGIILFLVIGDNCLEKDKQLREKVTLSLFMFSL